MVKKTVTYTDFDGNERKEDFYFNLTKTEIAEMELSVEGGFSNKLKTIVDSKNTSEIFYVFKDFVLKSVGEKSPDGLHFKKSKELSEAFANTMAFDTLMMELVSDADKASAFVRGLIPKELAEKIPTDTGKLLNATKN